MNVLHTWIYFQESIKYHVNYIAAKQARVGNNVKILAGATVNPAQAIFLPSINSKAGLYSYSGSSVERVPVQLVGRKAIPNWRDVARVVRDFEPSIVHIYGLTEVMSLMVLAIVARQHPSVPVIVNDHSNPHRKKQGFGASMYYSAAERIVRRYRDVIYSIISPNIATSDHLKKRYPFVADKVEIIPLGYNSDRFSLNVGPRNTEDRLIIIFAGKVDADKRVDRLIRAISSAGLQGEVRCIIAGINETGIYWELKVQAQQLGVDVEWLPFQSADELATLYAYADLAVYPGSVSITTLEATGCGTPVVLYESIPGLEDRVEGGRGFLFTTDEELQRRLREYRDLKQYGAIDHEAVAAASLEYCWSRVARRYDNVYRQALSALPHST